MGEWIGSSNGYSQWKGGLIFNEGGGGRGRTSGMGVGGGLEEEEKKEGPKTLKTGGRKKHK